MPRAGDPRVVVRMSPEGFAAVKAAAEASGLSVSALMRDGGLRYAAELGAMRKPALPMVPGVVFGSQVPIRDPRPSSGAMSRQERLNASRDRALKGRRS